MTYGMMVRGNDGSVIIDEDSSNYYIDGPFASTNAAGIVMREYSAGFQMDQKIFATHFIDVYDSSNKPPLLLLGLVPTDAVYLSTMPLVANLGVVRTSTNNFRFYIMSTGAAPFVYFAKRMSEAAIPDWGMLIYSSTGVVVYNSAKPIMDVDFIPNVNLRVGSTDSNAKISLKYSSYQLSVMREGVDFYSLPQMENSGLAAYLPTILNCVTLNDIRFNYPVCTYVFAGYAMKYIGNTPTIFVLPMVFRARGDYTFWQVVEVINGLQGFSYGTLMYFNAPSSLSQTLLFQKV